MDIDKESKQPVLHRDLTGQEKNRLLKNIDISTLFPNLPNLESCRVTFETMKLPDTAEIKDKFEKFFFQFIKQDM